MYLANDVIQNSKKKGPEFGKEFENVLPKAFDHLKSCDARTKSKIGRLINIWEERGVYDKPQITIFKNAFGMGTEISKEPGTPPPRKNQPGTPPPKKKPKIDNDKVSFTLDIFLYLFAVKV